MDGRTQNEAPQIRASDMLQAMQNQRNEAMDKAAEWEALAVDRLRIIEMLQAHVTELRNHTHDDEKTDGAGDSDVEQ